MYCIILWTFQYVYIVPKIRPLCNSKKKNNLASIIDICISIFFVIMFRVIMHNIFIIMRIESSKKRRDTQRVNAIGSNQSSISNLTLRVLLSISTSS